MRDWEGLQERVCMTESMQGINSGDGRVCDGLGGSLSKGLEDRTLARTQLGKGRDRVWLVGLVGRIICCNLAGLFVNCCDLAGLFVVVIRQKDRLLLLVIQLGHLLQLGKIVRCVSAGSFVNRCDLAGLFVIVIWQ